MNLRNLFIFLVLLLVGVTATFFIVKFKKPTIEKPLITNFEECKNAGYPIMETSPMQCKTPDGIIFAQDIKDQNKETLNKPITEFNKKVILRLNDKVTFSDGLVITLKEINDFRCKPNVQCVWADEIFISLLISKEDSFFSQWLRLGTGNNKSIAVEKYKFSLVSATANSATITVSFKDSTSSKSGYLSGHMSIGTFCPVEKEGEVCKVPPEAYSSRKVVIYLIDKVTVKQELKIDSDGNFKATLSPGEYYAQIVPAGIGEGEKKYFKIESLETTTLYFDIDTGIR